MKPWMNMSRLFVLVALVVEVLVYLFGIVLSTIYKLLVQFSI